MTNPSAILLREIVERLFSGATLREESQKLGFTHNVDHGPLRGILRTLLGRETYNDVMTVARLQRRVNKQKESVS